MNVDRSKSMLRLAGLCLVFVAVSGCVTKYPTIAHVHIGHAITGAHDTPSGEGYFVVAERRAQSARELAETTLRPGSSVATLQSGMRELNEIVNDSEFSLKRAMEESDNHIQFAAESADASANVRTSAAQFKRDSDGVLYRTSLIGLYVRDGLSSNAPSEVAQLASEVSKLAAALVTGEDLDGNGSIGDSPREFGLMQLRQELDDMIARENPPYTTVERWYLLNLVRMPSGEWIFRRSGSRSGSSY